MRRLLGCLLRRLVLHLDYIFSEGDDGMNGKWTKALAVFLAAVSLFGVLAADLGTAEARRPDRQTARRMDGRTRARGTALKPGDCIGVLAPASWEARAEWEDGVRLLKSRGYRVKLAPSCTAVYGFFAGTDEARAADVNRFFCDDEVRAILCLCGGYGSARLLDKLDYGAIARHPKPLIGFSDNTALHVALGEKSGIVTVHGPMLVTLANKSAADYTAKEFFRGLSSDRPLGELPTPGGRKMKALVPGRAEGVVVGGNLSMILSLIGTPYELKADGALLLLEDVDMASYKVDRALNQLWQSGLLSRVNGVLFGAFTGGDDDLDPGDPTTAEVIDYYARLAGKPAITNVPAGHIWTNAYIPFGVHAVMNTNADGTASLVFDEAAALPRESAK